MFKNWRSYLLKLEIKSKLETVRQGFKKNKDLIELSLTIVAIGLAFLSFRDQKIASEQNDIQFEKSLYRDSSANYQSNVLFKKLHSQSDSLFKLELQIWKPEIIPNEVVLKSLAPKSGSVVSLELVNYGKREAHKVTFKALFFNPEKMTFGNIAKKENQNFYGVLPYQSIPRHLKLNKDANEFKKSYIIIMVKHFDQDLNEQNKSLYYYRIEKIGAISSRVGNKGTIENIQYLLRHSKVDTGLGTKNIPLKEDGSLVYDFIDSRFQYLNEGLIKLPLFDSIIYSWRKMPILNGECYDVRVEKRTLGSYGRSIYDSIFPVKDIAKKLNYLFQIDVEYNGKNLMSKHISKFSNRSGIITKYNFSELILDTIFMKQKTDSSLFFYTTYSYYGQDSAVIMETDFKL